VRAGKWEIVPTLERLGSVPGHNTHPKGLNLSHELNDLFGDIDTQKYVVPGFTPDDCRKAFSRYDAVTGCYNVDVLRKATTWAYRIWAPYMHVPFSTHEEVIGNFDRSTSPGYPYTMWWSTKGKMEEEVGFDWLSDSYAYWLNNHYQGIFKNFLKEEVREKGKDTRGILAGPIDINYIMSRFFLAQNLGFYDSYLTTPSAIGISRDGLEWNAAFRKLAKFPQGADLDARSLTLKCFVF